MGGGNQARDGTPVDAGVASASVLIQLGVTVGKADSGRAELPANVTAATGVAPARIGEEDR
jgi:hypothetical protein